MASKQGEVELAFISGHEKEIIDATQGLIGIGDTIEILGKGRRKRILIRSSRAGEIHAALAASAIPASLTEIAAIPPAALEGPEAGLLGKLQAQGAAIVGIEQPLSLASLPAALLADAPLAGALGLLADADAAAGGGEMRAPDEPCPGPAYIGTGQGYGLDIVFFPSTGNTPKREAEAEAAALADATAHAIADASRAALGVTQPECAPCTCVLSISITTGEAKRLLDAKTLPEDAPARLREALATTRLDTVYAIYTAKVTWEAWWLCVHGDGKPKKPGDNPGSDTVLSGGSAVAVPCPHPFLAGQVKLGDQSIYQADTPETTPEALEREKARIFRARMKELQDKLTEAIREATAKLSHCPAGCPQRGPMGIQIGPNNNAVIFRGSTNRGDKYEFKDWYCHWSVERNCMPKEE